MFVICGLALGFEDPVRVLHQPHCMDTPANSPFNVSAHVVAGIDVQKGTLPDGQEVIEIFSGLLAEAGPLSCSVDSVLFKACFWLAGECLEVLALRTGKNLLYMFGEDPPTQQQLTSGGIGATGGYELSLQYVESVEFVTATSMVVHGQDQTPMYTATWTANPSTERQ